jgi:hypothetical protein
MAGSLSDVAEIDLLKLITGQATTIFTSTPITPYLALFTAAPSDSAAGTEATGGGYARISSAGAWGAPAAGQVQNSAQVNFAAFTGAVSAGSPFVAFAVMTALTAGSIVAWGDLSDITKTGANGDQMVFPAASLTITAD